jgi:uncharacterized protein (DUF1330 family)
MKKAYVYAEVEIHDPDSYPTYSVTVAPTLEPYGGKVLARGGAREQLEGADALHHKGLRTVILEFPSLQHARDWYFSDAYTKSRQMRQQWSTGRLCIVEGA